MIYLIVKLAILAVLIALWRTERDIQRLRRDLKGGAWLAKQRLSLVIPDDRAAVPCGRWVRCSPRLDIWRMRAVQAAALGLPIPPFPTGEELWPRYRWSERR